MSTLDMLVAASLRRGATQDTTPYPMPTADPYNAPTYAATPTPDGTGSGTHPSVVDFGAGNAWHGYRYWMAFTPYFQSNPQIEDPAIVGSRDGFTWTAPAGLTNPAFPSPAGTPYYSDTELVHDPDLDRLVLVWRETDDVPAAGARWVKLWASTSTDGTTWTAPVAIVSLTGLDAIDRLLSPAIVRMGAGDWRMWTGERNSLSLIEYRTAADPLGAWSTPQATTFTGGTARNPWHHDVIFSGGAFRFYGASNVWDHYAATSADGIAWTRGGVVMSNQPDPAWDSITLYRGTITPHEDGQHYRVWYGSNGPQSWRIGYTQVPRSLWPTPPPV